MVATEQSRHAAILDHLATLLMVSCRGTQHDPDAPLPPAIIEPAVVLLLSTYPNCPDEPEVRAAMQDRTDVDSRICDRLATRWSGWCKLLNTAIPMGALRIDHDAVARLRSPALVEMLNSIGASRSTTR